jgi:hypothetical protein
VTTAVRRTSRKRIGYWTANWCVGAKDVQALSMYRRGRPSVSRADTDPDESPGVFFDTVDGWRQSGVMAGCRVSVQAHGGWTPLARTLSAGLGIWAGLFELAGERATVSGRRWSEKKVMSFSEW